MSSDSILVLVLGVLGGAGGVILFGFLRGRRAGGRVSAGAARRAEQAHTAVDQELAHRQRQIDADRARDHADARERWRVGE